VRARAIVPAKGFARAKTRLAPALDAVSRAELARSMFDHVLDVLGESPDIAGVVVVTDADDVEVLARARGARCVRDAGQPPLSVAVDAGLDAVRRGPSSAALVMMADLPLLSSRDVRDLLTALDGADVVVAPDARGTGTNALGFARGVSMPSAFGRSDSLAAHRERAGQLGLRLVTYAGRGTAYDVDLPGDLAAARRLLGGPSVRGRAKRNRGSRASSS